MIAAPMSHLMLHSNGEWKSALNDPGRSAGNKISRRDVMSETKINSNSMNNVKMPKRNQKIILVNVDDDDMSQDSTIQETVDLSNETQKKVVRRQKKAQTDNVSSEKPKEEASRKTQQTNRARIQERRISRHSSKDGRRGRSSEGIRLSSKEPEPVPSAKELARHRASSREGRKRSSSKDAKPRSTSKDSKPKSSSSGLKSDGVPSHRSRSRESKPKTRSSSQDVRPERRSSQDARPQKSSISKDTRPIRSSSKDARPKRSSSNDARSTKGDSLSSPNSNAKDSKPIRANSMQCSQSKWRSSSKEKSKAGQSSSRDNTGSKSSVDPIRESPRPEPSPQARGRPSLANTPSMLKRSNRSLSRERPPSSRELLGASSAENSMKTGQDESSITAASRMAKEYGITSSIAPSKEASHQPSSRRMLKGTMNADSSPRIPSKMQDSSRNISLNDSTSYGKPNFSSSRNNDTMEQLNELPQSLRSMSNPRPASDRSSGTSESHGSMALKSPSRPGDAPAKRPQRYRGRKKDRATTPPPPPPARPVLVKTQSDRFLDLAADSPAMGLSAPRRSFSPLSNRKKNKLVLSPKMDQADLPGTPVTAKALSAKDFRAQEMRKAKLNDSFLNFASEDWACKDIAKSKKTRKDPIPEETENIVLFKTSHSDSGGRRSRKADPLSGKAKTVHVSKERDGSEDGSILDYDVDEWATDDEEDPTQNQLAVSAKKTKPSSALDTLKSKGEKKKKPVSAYKKGNRQKPA